MKNLLTILFLLVVCACPSPAQTNSSPCAPAKESDWKHDELQGRVRSIKTYKSWYRKEESTGRAVEGKRDLEEEASYDAAGNQTAWKNVNYLPRDPKDDPSYTYVCDAANRVAEIRIVDPDGKPVKKITYGYDKRGHEVEVAEYSPDGTLDSKEQYSVDEKGNVVEAVSTKKIGPEHFYPKRPDVVYVATKSTFKYDDRGNVTEEKHFYPDGSLYATWIKSYDSSGKLVRVLRSDKQGRPEDLTIYSYHSGLLAEELDYSNFCYNGDGSMCKGNLNTDAGSFYYGTRTTYEYDSRGNWIKQIEYVISEAGGKKSYEPSTAMYREIVYY